MLLVFLFFLVDGFYMILRVLLFVSNCSTFVVLDGSYSLVLSFSLN